MITKKEYELLKDELHRLMALDPEPNTIEGYLLVNLANSIEEYEKANFPIIELCKVVSED